MEINPRRLIPKRPGGNTSRVSSNMAGNQLIQLDEKTEGALKRMKHALHGALGSENEIRMWTDESQYEIRYLDALKTKEVAEELTTLLIGERILNSAMQLIQSVNADTQMAVITRSIYFSFFF